MTLSNSASSTVFVAKYNPNGDFLWATQVPGRGSDGVSGIGLDLRTNCWISGYTASASEGGQPVSPEALLAWFRPDGSLLTVANYSASGTSRAAAVGNLYNPFQGTPMNTFACGSFATSFTFANLSLTNSGVPDVFVTWIISPFELSTIVTKTSLVISWPVAGSQGYALESATDLTNWSPATGELA
jgi:hypothetical protein